MAMPTPVNGQITDAVTQANVSVLGQSPAMAMGAIAMSLAQAQGLLFANMVSGQQQLNILAQAATAQGVATLLGAGGVTFTEASADADGA